MHLTENDIALYLDHVLADDERRRIEEHLADCAACVSHVAAVARYSSRASRSHAPAIPRDAIARAEQIVEPRSSGSSQQPSARRVRFAFGGAALALCLLVAILVFNRPEISRFRSHGGRAASLEILTPSDGAGIVNDEVFRWKGMRSAIAYRFTLFDQAGLPLWETVSSDTALTLPPSVELHHGRRYLWQVEALFPDQTVERSELNVVTFSP